MVLSYPAGRVRDRIERAFLVAAYVVTLLWQLAPALFADFRCAGCSPARPFAAVHRPRARPDRGREGLLDRCSSRSAWRSSCSSSGGCGGARRPARRTLLPLVLAAACFTAAEFIVLRAASLTDWSQAFGVLNWIDLANTLVVPAAIFVGLATIRRQRGPLGDLVIELSRRASRPDRASAGARGRRSIARARVMAARGAALRRLRRCTGGCGRRRAGPSA